MKNGVNAGGRGPVSELRACLDAQRPWLQRAFVFLKSVNARLTKPDHFCQGCSSLQMVFAGRAQEFPRSAPQAASV